MKIKNLKFSKNCKTKLAACVLAGTVSATMLTGCGNLDMLDTQYTFNKAIIFGDNTATIVEITQWGDYDGEQFQIKLKNGFVMITSSFDTKLIDDRNSDITAEDLARSIKGEDVEIIYLDEVPKTRIR